MVEFFQSDGVFTQKMLRKKLHGVFILGFGTEVVSAIGKNGAASKEESLGRSEERKVETGGVYDAVSRREGTNIKTEKEIEERV
ncbi:hypothetical protein Nepgr_009591 [Nepenthes gracilis]|uniref:Uncharacterized protein n=1 Tax=Nepenthes gracilis TaxID=150966 RepID=A0AAD3SBB7_NEPGR|nr:hypothetical protein Nepgr_009591 [Nepenthes gracilis]